MDSIGVVSLIIVFVIVVMLGFRKSIVLLLIKKIYGEYSKKYVLAFKKRTRRKPHPYCFKDDFYYHVMAIPKAINCEIQYKSVANFSFNHLDFTKTFKTNLSEIGTPDCFTLSEDPGVDLKVFGYKSRMFHSNEKTLLYHCKNDYFMGEYVFTSLADDTSDLILEMLQKQYNKDVKHAKNFSIYDENGNYLYFTDTGFFLSLKFFNKNNPFIEKTMKKFGDDDKKLPLEGLGKAICY